MALHDDKIYSYHPDDIVISGASGVFPDCENIEEFKKSLFSGKELVSPMIKSNISELPSTSGLKTGLANTTDHFDYSFFHVSSGQAKNITISSRLILEKTFEAIVDAGYNPQEIKGRNISVVCGISDHYDKNDLSWEETTDDYESLKDRSESMIANRISNWLDIHGPSLAVNAACSSSMYALDYAIKYMQNDQCEAAIVCSPNICFPMAKDAENKLVRDVGQNSSPFDADASAHIRSESVVVVFLQRRKDARRIYANIIHSTTNYDRFKENFSHPSIEQQKQLYDKFYKAIKLDPLSISYIEAHGTSTKEGDIAEGTSIEEFFCNGRKEALKIGTVKSNIGHTEAAATLCSVVKMIIAFETGFIPPNLHYKNPNPGIKGLCNGNLKVVTESTPLEGRYFALNTFGSGGSNGHILLSPHNKIKQLDQSADKAIPRIVAVSGHTEEALDTILNDLENHPTDMEYIALMHNIFSDDISGHSHRGYVILDQNKDHQCTKSKTLFSGEKRPIWFIFPGMASQWSTMGRSLMNIPLFGQSIHRSHQILQTKGLDLINIITEDDSQVFLNVVNSFVGIIAIQIAFVDTLTAMQIQPNGMVGYSVGELGCAYADGCFTAEQTILTAYYCSLAILKNNIIPGKMVSIAESPSAMKEKLPEGIDIACHNSPYTCTVSGTVKQVEDFVGNLEKKKILHRLASTSNVAFHSRYITSTAEPIKTYLKQIIVNPRPRSDKWICTSAPESEWNNYHVRHPTAEYFTNNMLNKVYFEEAVRYIPSNAITIEIAAHGLLTPLFKYSLPDTVQSVVLAMRGHQDNVDYFLNAIGRLYELGCTSQLSNLYPPIEFPVSKSTPMISPLIKW